MTVPIPGSRTYEVRLFLSHPVFLYVYIIYEERPALH